MCFVQLSHARLRAENHGLVRSPSPLVPQCILLFISADMEKSSEGAFTVWSFHTKNGKNKDFFIPGVSEVGELLCS